MNIIKKIKQLRKKQSRGQKSINCMGGILDINEAIGILADTNEEQINYKLREKIIKELKEETGLDIRNYGE